MKKIIKTMVIDSILGSLLKCNFDWNNVQLIFPHVGCFTRRADVRAAQLTAKIMLDGIKDQIKRNSASVPQTPEEIEDFIVMRVVELSFNESLGKVNSPFHISSRESLINDMKDDLNDMRELGEKEAVSIYTKLMKEKIGEH